MALADDLVMGALAPAKAKSCRPPLMRLIGVNYPAGLAELIVVNHAPNQSSRGLWPAPPLLMTPWPIPGMSFGEPQLGRLAEERVNDEVGDLSLTFSTRDIVPAPGVLPERGLVFLESGATAIVCNWLVDSPGMRR